MDAHLDVVVVTGLSGAGRSTALRVLEDIGFYCVDNLPPALAPELLESVAKASLSRVGLGIDVRTGEFLSGTESALSAIEASGHKVEVMFLDCSDDVLVRRFSETRRPHALAPEGDLLAGIRTERQRLAWLRSRADQVIDTTKLNVHDLRRRLVEHARGEDRRGMVVRLVSFGFKYGLPVDADLVFDLRYLPNPHFVPELKPLTGTDEAVSSYVLEAPRTKDFLGHLWPLLEYSLPNYAAEGKAYLTIAFGCTGGRHRSVAIVEELASMIGKHYEVTVAHRDVDRSGK